MMASDRDRFDDTFRRLERFRGIVIAKLGSDYLHGCSRLILALAAFTHWFWSVTVGLE